MLLLISPVVVHTAPPERRPDGFDARDTLYPYTCTFHWFRLPDESIVGLDVIRSDESTDPRQVRQMGLRVFLLSPGKPMRWLVEVHDHSEWDAYFDGDRPAAEVLAETVRPVLGRGKGSVAAAVSSDARDKNQITRVSFWLDICPQSKMKTNGNVLGPFTAFLSRQGLHLSATDFTRVVTRGTITIDRDAPVQVESAGPASIHYGQFLPEYAYVASVPGVTTHDTDSVDFLLASVHADDFAIPVPKDLPFTYAYARGKKMPKRMFTFAKALKKGSSRIPLGNGWTLALTDIQPPVEHKLLSVPTWTMAAKATLERSRSFFNPHRDEALDIGTVIVDFRGDYYIDILQPEEP